MYLGVQEGAKDGNSSTEGIYGLDGGVEDDYRRYNHRDALHGVSYAERQR